MKITQAHFDKAFESMGYSCNLIDVMNRCMEIAQAESEQFITADEARALGAGAEYYQPESERWITCEHLERFPASFHDGEVIKYRAIKQPKPVEPQPRDEMSMHPDSNAKSLLTDQSTCQVQLIGGEVQTMTREAAKKLHKQTRETHAWKCPHNPDVIPMDFVHGGIYTYKPKAKKVISWSSLPVGIAVKYRGQTYPIYRSPIQSIPVVITTDGMRCQNFENTDFDLAPASEQPWLNWRGGECPVPEGVIVEVTLRNKTHSIHDGNWKWADNNGYYGCDIIEYHIVGIESGYVLGGN